MDIRGINADMTALKTAYGILFAVLWMAKGYITAWMKGL